MFAKGTPQQFAESHSVNRSTPEIRGNCDQASLLASQMLMCVVIA